MADYGLKFKELRLFLKLSQEEFAASIGMTRASIGQIELQNQRPTLDNIEAAATKYSIPYDYFFTDRCLQEAFGLGPEKSKPPNIVEEGSCRKYGCPHCSEKDEQVAYLKKLIAYQEMELDDLKSSNCDGQKRKAG